MNSRRRAQLPVAKTLADLDWGAIPDLDQHQIEQLAHDTGWLNRSAHIFSTATLVQELQRAKAD